VTTIFELVDADDAAGIRDLLAAEPGRAGERDEQGLSPLFRALYHGRSAALGAIREAVPQTDPWERLIAGHADGLPEPNARSGDGFTPLHLAAFAHNAPAARALLDAGADPDAFSTASFARVTPLGTCAFANEPEVARLLLEHGADPSLAEREGGTPLEVARANGYDELAALLEAG
jgi:ankyrin repeat protein